jgi:hypothetical protein
MPEKMSEKGLTARELFVLQPKVCFSVNNQQCTLPYNVDFASTQTVENSSPLWSSAWRLLLIAHAMSSLQSKERNLGVLQTASSGATLALFSIWILHTRATRKFNSLKGYYYLCETLTFIPYLHK